MNYLIQFEESINQNCKLNWEPTNDQTANEVQPSSTSNTSETLNPTINQDCEWKEHSRAVSNVESPHSTKKSEHLTYVQWQAGWWDPEQESCWVYFLTKKKFDIYLPGSFFFFLCHWCRTEMWSLLSLGLCEKFFKAWATTRWNFRVSKRQLIFSTLWAMPQ